MRLTLAGGSPGADASLLAVPRRTALLGAYTATTIVAGFGALVVATALLLVSPDAGLRSDIAIGGLDGSVVGAAGVAVWILYALAGGTRMLRDPGGHATLTFHLPFIAAATILGGPVAGAWVAVLGTVDLRELREAPWYGVLANHAALILAAFAGGLVFEGTVAVAGAVGDRLEPGGAARRRASPARPSWRSSRRSSRRASSSCATASRRRTRSRSWTTRSGGPPWPRRSWAGCSSSSGSPSAGGRPPCCTVVVLTLWRASADAEALDHDALTGVLSRGAFARRAAEAADRARRGVDGAAYLFLDLDGFKAVNDGPRSHHVGDQVLAALGERLQRSVRVTDAVGRRGGDEFMVLFNGVRDEATAVAARGANLRRRHGAMPPTTVRSRSACPSAWRWPCRAAGTSSPTSAGTPTPRCTRRRPRWRHPRSGGTPDEG